MVNSQNEQMKKFEDTIQGYIKEGEKYIYPERLNDWKVCVMKAADGMYRGVEIRNVLDIMKSLEKNNDFIDAAIIMDSQHHSGGSYSAVMSILMKYCKTGTDFFRFLEKEISPETEAFMKKIDKENEVFAKNQKGFEPGE